MLDMAFQYDFSRGEWVRCEEDCVIIVIAWKHKGKAKNSINGFIRYQPAEA